MWPGSGDALNALQSMEDFGIHDQAVTGMQLQEGCGLGLSATQDQSQVAWLQIPAVAET